MSVPRSDGLLVLGTLLMSVVVAGCHQPSTGGAVARRPIIIVDIGGVRASHLGCYGYFRETSPNIDSFAAESVRFQWAFGQAPNTPPSQASILTGLTRSLKTVC